MTAILPEMPPFWVTCMLVVALIRLCACADADTENSARLPVLTGMVTGCPANCSCLKPTTLYCTVVDSITSFPVITDDSRAHDIDEM